MPATDKENDKEFLEDGKWVFNEAVTEVFDEMLEASIPQYEIMRKAVLDLGVEFIEPNTQIIDLGCSRGEAIAQLVRAFPKNEFYGIECSKPMVMACNQKFAFDYNVHIVEKDLREFFPDLSNVSLVLSVLALQFIPIEYRHQIVQNVYDSLRPGGAFIFVEKVLGNTSQIDKLFVDKYLNLKGGNGYSGDEIQRKKRGLEGVLVPITSDWNEDLLRKTGFRAVDCFWRWMNFAGWIAIK